MTVEFLAEELHKTYRAAMKALFNSVGHNHNHGHGWSNCHRKDYFRKRAATILQRDANRQVNEELDARQYAMGGRVAMLADMEANRILSAWPEALRFVRPATPTEELNHPITIWPRLSGIIPAGHTLGVDGVAQPAEDVAAYDALMKRWRGFNGICREMYYHAYRQTLDVVGLAAIRAARKTS